MKTRNLILVILLLPCLGSAMDKNSPAESFVKLTEAWHQDHNNLFNGTLSGLPPIRELPDRAPPDELDLEVAAIIDQAIDDPLSPIDAKFARSIGLVGEFDLDKLGVKLFEYFGKQEIYADYVAYPARQYARHFWTFAQLKTQLQQNSIHQSKVDALIARSLIAYASKVADYKFKPTYFSDPLEEMIKLLPIASFASKDVKLARTDVPTFRTLNYIARNQACRQLVGYRNVASQAGSSALVVSACIPLGPGFVGTALATGMVRTAGAFVDQYNENTSAIVRFRLAEFASFRRLVEAQMRCFDLFD